MWNGFAYPYYGGDPRAAVPDDLYSGIPAAGDRIAVPGRTGSDSLVVEQLTDRIVRLSWQDRGREVAEVGLFLADQEPPGDYRADDSYPTVHRSLRAGVRCHDGGGDGGLAQR